MIPKQVVEAAAKALADQSATRRWDDLAPMVRRIRLKKMASALEAATPHITASAVAYLDESVRMISSDPEVKDYERGFDDAIRGMSAKVKRLLNGEPQ